MSLPSATLPTIFISSLFFLLILRQIRKWAAGAKVPLHLLRKTSLSSQVALVTGANVGIGFETAKYLALLDARVIITCRNEEKLRETIAALKAACSESSAPWKKIVGEARVEGVVMELSDFESVKKASKEIEKRLGNDKLGIFIMNAGMFDKYGGITKDGFENMFQINYLSHFLLTQRLMERIVKDGTRVVQISSRAHTRFPSMTIRYDQVREEPKNQSFMAQPKAQYEWYSHSKLAQVLYTRKLHQIFNDKHSKASAVAVHPGVVRSSFSAGMPKYFDIAYNTLGHLTFKTNEEGAQTSVYAAIADVPSGEYLSDCALDKRHVLSDDAKAVDELYERSMEWVRDYM